MTLYSDTLRDELQRPIAGADVYVYAASGALASALTDELGAPIGNPVTTDEFGNFSFQVADGFYTLDIFFGGRRVFKQNLILGVIPLDGAKGLIASSRSALAAITGQSAGQAALLGESGREGTFVFSSANLSAQVTADPQQAVYVAPASAPTGASGAWVRKFTGRHNVKWFGAVGDDATNDGPAFLAALAYLQAISATGGTYGYPGKAAPSLFVPAGRYFIGTNTLDITTTVIIEGEGVGSNAAQSTVLRWSAGATGIRVQAANTSGATTSGLALAYSGDGSVIRNLQLYGGFTAASADFHGIHLRAAATVQDVFIDKFQGEGVYIIANAAGNNGNANNWRLERVMVQQCRTGIFVDGPDVNAGHAIGCSANQNRAWGMWDSSFLGNTYVACHTSGNVSGAYKTDDNSARNVLVGCYSESGQPASSFVSPTLVIGGLHAAGTGTYGGHLDGNGGTINCKGVLTVDSNILGSGTDNALGRQTGAATDTTLNLDNTSNNSNLVFRRWVAGVPTTDGSIAGANAIGGLNIVGRVAINLVINGIGTIADVSATAFNLGAGYVYKVAGVQVVGPRSTGWTADTGTAEKTTHATYAGGTANAAYNQAEITAIRNALQDVSRGQKAIKDALIAHGLLGA